MTLTDDGIAVDRDIDVANSFNDFFSSIGGRISAEFAGSSGNYADFLTGNARSDSFYFTPVSENTIKKSLPLSKTNLVILQPILINL